MQLETERLILRPIEESDAPALFPLINDADVAAGMLTIPHPYPEDAYVPWIRKSREAMERREMYEMAIVLKETGLPVGACTFSNISWVHMNAELGYWLGKEYWGRGYTTEAVRSMLAFGFEELGLERTYACCFTDNAASARVLEKAGFKYEGCARHEYRKDDKFMDMLRYGIIRQEYDRDVKGKSA